MPEKVRETGTLAVCHHGRFTACVTLDDLSTHSQLHKLSKPRRCFTPTQLGASRLRAHVTPTLVSQLLSGRFTAARNGDSFAALATTSAVNCPIGEVSEVCHTDLTWRIRNHAQLKLDAANLLQRQSPAS